MMEELRDLKPYALIPDDSIYWFCFLVFVLLCCLYGVYLLWQIRKKKIQQTPKYRAKKLLQNLPFHDSKESAYMVSKLAPFLFTCKEQEMFYISLLPLLEKYKYTDTPPPLSEEDKALINALLKMYHG